MNKLNYLYVNLIFLLVTPSFFTFFSQLQETTKEANRLHLEINDLSLENEEMRERLGLESREDLDLIAIRKKKMVKEEQTIALNSVLQKEVWTLIILTILNAFYQLHLWKLASLVSPLRIFPEFSLWSTCISATIMMINPVSELNFECICIIVSLIQFP